MILITGATGHIGKELIPFLLEAKQPMRVLVRDEKYFSRAGREAKWHLLIRAKWQRLQRLH